MIRSFKIISNVLLNPFNEPSIIGLRYIKRWVAPTLKELNVRQKKLKSTEIQLSKRSEFLEWNYDCEIYSFGKRLNENFDNNLLRQALTHKSYINMKQIKNENIDNILDNSDLIKKGELFIHNYINEYYNNYPIDIIKSINNYLMSDEMLYHVAYHLGLKDLILTDEYPIKIETFSNTFKSLVAIINNDNNQRNNFIKDFLFCQLINKNIYFDIWQPNDPINYLNNLINYEYEFRLCNKSGINTILANYQIGLYNKETKKLIGIGWGESINIAKESAALNAIYKIYNLK